MTSASAASKSSKRVIVATGPLTSPALAEAIQSLTGEDALAFFDALAPKYSDLIYTCHGGAIEYPPQFEAFLAKEPRFDGYVGGSSAEPGRSVDDLSHWPNAAP